MTKYEGSYKCKWLNKNKVCGHEFKAVFGKIDSVKGSPTQRGVKGICSAVKCPKCGHNLKPVTDAISIKELKQKGGMQQ